MNRLICIFLVGFAWADAAIASDASDYFHACIAEAGNKTGDARKEFLKECLKTGAQKSNAEDAEFQTTLTARRDATPAQVALIRKAMLYTLKDNESARFSEVSVRAERSSPTVLRACGMVNAKNSSGAYAGFSHFTAVLGETATVQAIDDNDSSNAAKVCRKWGM